MKVFLMVASSLGLSVAVLPKAAQAATYYVAKTGGGTTCSQASPCATIAAGLNKLAAGDTLSVGDGTYNEGIEADAIPSGISDTQRTQVKAQNRWQVTLIGVNSSSIYVMQVLDKNYIMIDGLNFDANGH